MFFIQEEIPPVSDAFIEGKLEMTHKVIQSAQDVISSDAYAAIVSILAVFFLVLLIYNIKSIFSILPIIIGALANRNINLNIEHIKKNESDRNSCAFIMSIPLAILLDRIDLIRPSFLSSVPDGWMTLILLAVQLAYYLLRKISLLLHKPLRMNPDAWKVLQNGWMNYYIIGTFLSCIAGVLLLLFKAGEESVRITVMSVFGLLYLINFVRNTQILSRDCSFLTTISYLCTLEIIPTGALILLGLL